MTVTFGDVLEIVERPIDLIDNVEYQLVTAKRSRGGVVARSRLMGREVLTKTQFQIARDDFLMSNRQIIHGGCGIVPPALDGAVVSNEYSVLRPKSRLLLEFLGYLSHSIYFQQTCFHASVGVDVEKMIFDCERWLGFKMHLPPLHEQRRIAEILSSVDEAIAATRAVIEQTRKVKQGVLERLLTKGIGHTRFKQTELGEIPEGWRIGTLGSIAVELEAGVSVNSENRPRQPGEIGILKTSCVSAGIFDPEEHKAVLPGERDRVKIPVRGDRIIISRMNTPNLVGANGYVENDIGDLFLPDRLWQLSTSENARWLACSLASDQSRESLSAIATGTSGSMKNISKSKLLDLLFAIPSQAEQQEIASIVQEINASIEADNRTLKGQIATKSALMSDLLTGRKRVTEALPMAAE
ncbi:restriction endonuclease subunit S [Sinorhizobium meliloti]|uniref:restriction endonuclease subunit S n=1 Tax=Rhizobium meliloti TaxID=382 RepID=UPI0013E2DB8A|nr:restriction endonuclease subunit S [Sinorhizobium meliloti]